MNGSGALMTTSSSAVIKKIVTFQATIMRLIDAERKPANPRYLVVYSLFVPIPGGKKFFVQKHHNLRGSP